MPYTLALAFLVTASLYAAVGFGGGSTYTALLVISGVDYRILPSLSLICNILVVSGGVWRFRAAGYVQMARLWPFLLASVPAAWLGGRLPVSEHIFVGLLALALLMAGIRLLFSYEGGLGQTERAYPLPFGLALFVGGGIGLLSGLVGIGGGVFLAPVLYLARWGSAREIAAACSVFILVNSTAGLAGQMSKLGDMTILSTLSAYWLLFPAVLVGGQIGSRLAIQTLQPILVRRLTAILILVVAVRLLVRGLGLLVD